MRYRHPNLHPALLLAVLLHSIPLLATPMIHFRVPMHYRHLSLHPALLLAVLLHLIRLLDLLLVRILSALSCDIHWPFLCSMGGGIRQ